MAATWRVVGSAIAEGKAVWIPVPIATAVFLARRRLAGEAPPRGGFAGGESVPSAG